MRVLREAVLVIGIELKMLFYLTIAHSQISITSTRTSTSTNKNTYRVLLFLPF